MNHSSHLFLLTLTALFFWQCSKNTSEPPPPAEPDTTSHNFTWTLDTIGTRSSYLLDVAIVNENDIWAVGEVHTTETDTFDSLGNWVPPYNAVHWNGSEWEFQRILVNFRGQPTRVALQGVFALKDGNVIFSSGLPYLPEANGWKLYHLWDMGVLDDEDGSVYQIWGTSLSNLYFAGSKGTIVHYDGSSWQKLDSGTEVDLLDVYGSPDGSIVWACGFTDFVGTVLLKITGTTIEKVYDDLANWGRIRQDSLSGTLTSLWTNNPKEIYIMSPAGMYRASADTRGEAERIWLNNNYAPGFPHILRGNAENDLFASGDFSTITHFNGKSWHPFSELTGRISFRGVASIHDRVFCVGEDYSSFRAIIAIGTR